MTTRVLPILILTQVLFLFNNCAKPNQINDNVSTASSTTGANNNNANNVVPDTKLPEVDVTVPADAKNFDAYSAAGSPTYPVNAIITVPAGVTVGSSDPAKAALTIGAFAAGSQVSVINNGSILGAGGAGGGANSGGGAGGAALEIQFPVSITNAGQIFGGGGGGGGGLTFLLPGVPGGNGLGSNFASLITALTGLKNGGYVFGYNGDGGTGGGWGQPGTDAQGPGGLAGAAILSNGFQINWVSGNTADNVKGAVK